MGAWAQRPDGSWGPAEPLPYLGWRARLEVRLRSAGFPRMAAVLARLDELGLARP